MTKSFKEPNKARRQQAEQEALQALSRARAKLVLGKGATAVFFGALALRLRIETSWDIETAATDGRVLVVNPDWFNSLPKSQQVGVVAHEVMHPAMQHHVRRGDRDLAKWNIAADAAINHILKDAGYDLPSEGVFPGEGEYKHLPKGLAAEEYYSLLPNTYSGTGNTIDPGGCGAVMDDGDEAMKALAAADWQIAVAQAQTVAKQRGDLPAGLARLIAEVLEPVIDWRSVLREFVSRHARNDYSWVRPNRRFVSQGLYLPSLHSEQIGQIVVAVDTSGSISDKTLSAFRAEIEGILMAFDVDLTILYCDCEIHRVQHWSPTDGPLVMNAVGGGGTSHVPIWKWLAEQAELPECVICLTDGQTDWGEDPGLPVLWCLTQDIKPPFGRAVLMV